MQAEIRAEPPEASEIAWSHSYCAAGGGHWRRNMRKSPAGFFGPFYYVLKKPDKTPKNGRLEATAVCSPTG